MTTRRTLIGHAALALTTLMTLTTLTPLAQAADFPSKTVTLIVPFAPGGPTDAMARILAASLRGPLGQTVIVENKAGAGGNLGYLPNVLVVNAKVPVHNLKELVALAKTPNSSLSYASSGNGASSHLAGVMFNRRAGTDIQHVPYKGTGPALNDLLGGQVTMTFTDVLTALPHIQAGKLRALGVTTAQRSKALPNVPTLAEQGMKDFDVSVFFGIVAPAGTPPDVVAKLNAAFIKVLADPEVRGRLSAQGLEPPADTTPAQLSAYMRSESDKWRDVVKASGAKAD